MGALPERRPREGGAVMAKGAEHYRIVGNKKDGYAVLTSNGAIEYDLLESRSLAVQIRNILNRGIGPDWDAVEREMEGEDAD